MTPSRTTHTGLRACAWVLSIALVLWTLVSPLFHPLRALSLTTVSDTLSTSKPGVPANHTIQFTTPSGVVDDGSTIELTLPSGFSIASIGEDDIDIADDGVDLTTAPSCGASEAAIATSSQTITITLCSGGGGTIAPGSVVTVEIGINATSSGTGVNRITNHATAGSYTLELGGTMADEGSTELVIIESVLVSGEVATYLEFAVDGVDANLSVNGDLTLTSGTTTATSVPFGTLAPNTAKVLAQDLSVTTNAVNGFTVTVSADTELISGGGAIIDSFVNGTATATPITWQPPAGTSGATTTYGHWGVTSEDATLSLGDSFGSALYAGDFITTPREVLYATTSADGSTAHIGATRVGFRAEISALQEAARDYTTTLTYIVTPVF